MNPGPFPANFPSDSQLVWEAVENLAGRLKRQEDAFEQYKEAVDQRLMGLHRQIDRLQGIHGA